MYCSSYLNVLGQSGERQEFNGALVDVMRSAMHDHNVLFQAAPAAAGLRADLTLELPGWFWTFWFPFHDIGQSLIQYVNTFAP